MTFFNYFLVSLLLAITPGPDIVFVFTQSLQHRLQAGMIVVLGLCTGLLWHMLLVLLGVSSLLLSSPNALIFIQSLGVLYLCYLGYNSFLSVRQKTNLLKEITDSREINPAKPHWRKFYLRGFVMNATNPKVLLFFIAILPQFLDVTRQDIGIAWQTVILGLLSVLATFICFSGVALFAGVLSKHLSHSVIASNAINIFSGSVFFGLATYLVLDFILI